MRSRPIGVDVGPSSPFLMVPISTATTWGLSSAPLRQFHQLVGGVKDLAQRWSLRRDPTRLPPPFYGNELPTDIVNRFDHHQAPFPCELSVDGT